MPVIQSKQCGDDKPGKNERSFYNRFATEYKLCKRGCSGCDTKRSGPCKSHSSK